jgi:hypothetical protein
VKPEVLMDDEPVTAEEAHALDEAREWLKHNKPIPHEQVLAELGITKEEIGMRCIDSRNRARGTSSRPLVGAALATD